jgi:hypothetical protein
MPRWSMLALHEAIIGLLFLLSVIGAAFVGFWAGGLSSPRKRLVGLVGAFLLVVPVYTGQLLITAPPSGSNAFTWWFIGLTWIAGRWCVVVGLGYLFGSLRRRPRN